MKKLLLIALLLAPLSALAISVSVPQSSSTNDILIGKTNGNWQVVSATTTMASTTGWVRSGDDILTPFSITSLGLPVRGSLSLQSIEDTHTITPMVLNTLADYTGNNTGVHPSVYYNDSGWNGYKYWMANTPYPGNDSAFENPSVYVSTDGTTWVVPPGGANPVIPAPPSGFNADPELFVDKNNTMWLLYTLFVGTDYSVMMASSSNGVNWSATSTLITSKTVGYASPAVVYDGTNYRMYFTDFRASPRLIKYITAPSMTGPWSAAITTSMPTIPNRVEGGNLYQWHQDVMIYKNEYYMISSFTPDGGSSRNILYLLKSTDSGNTWTVSDRTIAPPGVNNSGANSWLYKPTFIPFEVSGGLGFKVWCSEFANGNNAKTVSFTIKTDRATYEPSASKLLMYVPFEESTSAGSSVYDYSTTGIVGSTTAGVTSLTSTTTRIGNGHYYNGASQATSFPYNAVYNSYPATFVINAMATSTSPNTSFAGTYLSGSGLGWKIGIQSGFLNFWYYKDVNNKIVMDTLAFLADGVEHQIAVAVDSAGVVIFVDGMQVATSSWTGTHGATTATSPLTFGFYAPGGSYDIGTVDEFKIYNYKMTNNELLSLYESSFLEKKTPQIRNNFQENTKFWGNVGIGTTSPITKLDIWGNLNVGTSSTPVFFVNTATKMVGIGTNQPTNTFQIDAVVGPAITSMSTNSNARFVDTTSSALGVGGAFTFMGNYTGTSPTLAAGIKAMKTNGTAGQWGFDLALATRTNGSGELTEAMRISSIQNVGIGTTTPLSKLTVQGASAGTQNIANFASSTSSNGVEIRSDGTVRLTGTATSWEDLQLTLQPSTVLNSPVERSKYGSRIFSLEDEAINEDQIPFIAQLPHSWKEGSNVAFHVHFVGENNTACNFTIGVVYRWTNYGVAIAGADTVATSTIANSATSSLHNIWSTHLSGTGKTISSIITGTLYRNSTQASDTCTNIDIDMLAADIHYEQDGFGSDTEYGKTN